MKSSIGFSIQDLQTLSILFQECYQDIYGISLEEKFKNLGKTPILATHEEVVFFVLFQLKNALTYDVLGAVFGTNGSNAQRSFNQYLPLIRRILAKLSVLPTRNLKQSDCDQLAQQEQEIYLDATEIPVQRPDNQEHQKELYSGKKKDILRKVR